MRKRTPQEIAFLKSYRNMPDHLQKAFLKSMETFNQLPPGQRTAEKYRTIFIANGMPSQAVVESAIETGMEFEAGIEPAIQLDAEELAETIAQLRKAIATIVSRHRAAGDPLTWRLIYAIEEEAFQQLAGIIVVNPVYVGMLHSSPLYRHSKTDEPVEFGDSLTLSHAHSLIKNAYMMH